MAGKDETWSAYKEITRSYTASECCKNSVMERMLLTALLSLSISTARQITAY